MSKMNSVGPGIDSKPHLSLEGKHAKVFIKHKIGDKVTGSFEGKKTSHFQHSSGVHTVGIDIHKMTPGGAEGTGALCPSCQKALVNKKPGATSGKSQVSNSERI